MCASFAVAPSTEKVSGTVCGRCLVEFVVGVRMENVFGLRTMCCTRNH